jgi:uncharacterized protein (TIGR02996 family)
MTEETAFLNKLLELPADDNTRLIYADWLEERGDDDALRKARFLRLVTQPDVPDGYAKQAQLEDLSRELDPIWLTYVDKTRIEECHSDGKSVPEGRWPFRTQREMVCPKTWDQLAATDDVSVRFCGECQQNVYHCTSIEEARNHVAEERCVSLSLAVPRHTNDLRPRMLMRTMGIIRADRLSSIEENINDRKRRDS